MNPESIAQIYDRIAMEHDAAAREWMSEPADDEHLDRMYKSRADDEHFEAERYRRLARDARSFAKRKSA